MGVKHFYLWYKSRFQSCISQELNQSIDNFAIDMNGLFHLCAQKIYRYGNYHQPALLMKHKPSITQVCKEICSKIEQLKTKVNPKKRLILCVDGVAGLAKMNQQRQRRFRAAKTNHTVFDSNSITPGTQFMDYITKYIDGYLKMMISCSPEWQHLEIIYSNEKVPGEGEHKIMNYIRSINHYESCCIYGLDADLIMLGMLLPTDKVYIYREMEYATYHFMDIQSFKKELLRIMRWSKDDSSKIFSEKRAIYDFVALCFIVGNDFLPTIPSMAILDGTIDMILNSYKEIGKEYGHITKQNARTKELTFSIGSLRAFLLALAKKEKQILEDKYNDGPEFFPDPLVLDNMNLDINTNRMILDFDQYRNDYYKCKFKDVHDINHLVKIYIDGMIWVLNYYVNGIPDWQWYFPYLYAPFLVDIIECLGDYQSPQFIKNQPVDPFLQLLIVLPSSSQELLPLLFHRLMSDKGSSLIKYYPKDFDIDLSGKRKEWEGIVQLPPITIDDFKEEYMKHITKIVDIKDIKRNKRGKTFVYTFDGNMSPYELKTLYGIIPEYRVKYQIIQI